MTQENGQSRRLVVGLIVGAIFGIGVGLLVGLAYAYGVAPLKWSDVPPQDLREDYGSYYWQLVAESYSSHGDLEVAQKQLGEWDNPERLKAALARARIESSPETAMAIESLSTKLVGAEIDAQPTPGETPADESTTGLGTINWGTFLGVLLLILLVLVLVALIISRARKGKEEAPASAEAPVEEAEWLATTHPEEEAPPPAALGHFVTSYALGNDHYDESFSIETSTGEFLGECGVGISETIGEGSPDQVTAFEIWLFDKNDIRTVTKVLMSEYAYNDTELRDRLAPKGEAMLAQANTPIVLETATLRVEATATEVSYGANDLPPNSFFEQLVVELIAQQGGSIEEAPPPPPSPEEDEFEV
jgi:hypothetical protein